MGVIYLLYNDNGYGYIGQTKRFHLRKYQHKTDSQKSTAKLLGEWKYEILERVENADLIDYERYYYDMYNEMFPNMLVNKRVPNSSYNETQKRRQEKDKLINSLKPKRIYKKDENKISKKDYDVMYREKRKYINCECGGKYTSNHKSTHIKTAKHQNFTPPYTPHS